MIRKKSIVTIGVLLVFTGLFLIFNNYFALKKNKVYDTISLAMSELPSYIESDNEDINNNDNIVPGQDDNDNTNANDGSNENNETNQEENVESNVIETPLKYYIGKLEIPKINFSRGFASIESSYNNVNKNIAVIKGSTYPNVSLGNFILAGHSGSGWNSFFNDLHKLKLNDIAYIYYDGIKYKYKLVNIYEEEKNGTVRIYKDNNKTTLTLVTCTLGTKDKQSVFIFNLQTKEEY